MAAKVALVLSGGVALGAYQAGAYAALHASPALWPGHIAASSAGAVNGAIIASTSPDVRVRALRSFWQGMASDRHWPGARWIAALPGPYRRGYRWLQALQTRAWGCAGVMRPRLLSLFQRESVSLYDLAPLRARLETEVDFDRVNNSAVRLTVTTTDVETGEPVVFDTGEAARADDLLCFVVDLFAPVGRRPTTLEQAAVRCIDLLFANQTARALRAFERTERLRQAAAPDARRATVVSICYSGGPDEPGPQKLFDFSSAALTERWTAGHADMGTAIAGLEERRDARRAV